MAHPRHSLDPVLQTPLRFSLLAALGSQVEVDFATLRDFLEAGDSALSKAVSHLEAAGYITVRKGFVGKRPRTWVEATRKGQQALTGHVEALRTIAAEAAPTPGQNPENDGA